MHTTKLEDAMQAVSDAEVALAKIDDEFARRNSLRAVGVVVNKFFAQ